MLERQAAERRQAVPRNPQGRPGAWAFTCSLWCESYNTLTRAVDRLTLREIEFRVAMQMSAADSTSLIDSPAATLLGEHRALLYRDDLGTQTKFRPYGPPSAEWLAWAARQFQRDVASKP